MIDDSAPVLGTVGGRFQGLDVMTALYLGGVPLDVAAAAAKDTDIANGFVGEPHQGLRGTRNAVYLTRQLL